MSDSNCVACGESSTVGCGSGTYHYYACDKCWQNIKRGKIKMIEGVLDSSYKLSVRSKQPKIDAFVETFVEENTELMDALYEAEQGEQGE